MGVAPINSSVLHLSRVCLSALNSKLDFSRMSPYYDPNRLASICLGWLSSVSAPELNAVV